MIIPWAFPSIVIALSWKWILNGVSGAYIYDNFLFLKEFLANTMPLVRYEIPQATYLAWLDFSALQVPADFAELRISTILWQFSLAIFMQRASPTPPLWLWDRSCCPTYYIRFSVSSVKISFVFSSVNSLARIAPPHRRPAKGICAGACPIRWWKERSVFIVCLAFCLRQILTKHCWTMRREFLLYVWMLSVATYKKEGCSPSLPGAPLVEHCCIRK